MTHSPEPWEAMNYGGGVRYIHDAKNEEINKDQYHDGEMGIGNAERIVACVNACKGIPTKELNGGLIEFMTKMTRNVVKHFHKENAE